MTYVSDPYLIAHRVRGEPAFDIATRMECPLCAATGCFECDSLGYWWIIPTSGHRAFPFFEIRLDGIEFEGNGNYSLLEELTAMPEPWPDHYPTAATPARTADFARILGLESKSTTGIRRR